MAPDPAGNSSEPMDGVGSVLEPLADEVEGSPTAWILIVDDDPSQRLLMRKVLEQKGFGVIEAADGVEACRLNEEHRPDLLLVDLMMPRMDGYELCRELRGQTHSADVPIVVTTSRDDIVSIVRAYDAGATDFVPKPVNWLVLSHRLHYILRASRAFAELRGSQERLSAAEEPPLGDGARQSGWEDVLPHRRMLPNHRLVASPLLLPLPQRSSARDRTSLYLCHMLVCCGGTCGVVGDAPASSKRSGKSTGCCWSDAPPPARPASTIVVPNTIWCATSRRHSFIRR